MRPDGITKSWKLARTGLTVVALLASGIGWIAVSSPWAASTSPGKRSSQGHAEAGRSLFNGKGVCYYCHGVDGYLKKRPDLADDTAALIARLNIPPADLRNPKTLRLKNDTQRAQAVREGHPGTGMFPDTTITDQELADALAYLAVLRKEGSVGPQ